MKHRRYDCLNAGMEGHRRATVTRDGQSAVCHQKGLCGVNYEWDAQEDRKGRLVSGRRPRSRNIVVIGGCRASRVSFA